MITQPIGIFDSGIGGLTVLKEIRRLLPEESLIYFGDTARVPYGTKSSQVIQEYALQASQFLLRKNVKLIVAACHSATATALPYLQSMVPVPVIGVVEPGIQNALAFPEPQRIGVIGTRSTIQSAVYQQSLQQAAPDVSVFAQACPLFVPLAEEGILEGPILDQVCHLYLSQWLQARLSVLILGCTHYPLLKNSINTFFNDQVPLVDSAIAVAEYLRNYLINHEMLNPGGISNQDEMYVSDLSPAFEETSARFLGTPLQNIQVVQLNATSV